MGQIENIKIYSGNDLETIFFRPMLVGQNAEELGIRVLYNMPVPTTIQLWSPQTDILQPYSTGWSGGDGAQRMQKTLELCKVKAEVGFSASDYFSQVYELITNRADVNLDDLTGSELEQAETEMFRAAVAENLRLMMWAGDTAAPVPEKHTAHRHASVRPGSYPCRSTPVPLPPAWRPQCPPSAVGCGCPDISCYR